MPAAPKYRWVCTLPRVSITFAAVISYYRPLCLDTLYLCICLYVTRATTMLL